jgi:hypothetical protein
LGEGVATRWGGLLKGVCDVFAKVLGVSIRCR